MERCKNCGRYYGEPKKVAVGEKCKFTVTTYDEKTGSIRKASGVTGKLKYIFSNSCYSVEYRKNKYYVDTVAHPDDPSPLTLAFVGRCTCPAK
ncbi:hypothetical protein [Xenorhabdus sp. PB62.4]|uniref:hypothetical protein n=1 Tax=Xenorhabdus sp. PB62.4 TaxID=1851573 RepID=UPI0016576476|nr:hypothetical protein [Xenorhabdus sp. PB62.4]MBC8954891.1 hypothetical protein [Xenorhabdus sp. PB62.4]